MTIWQVVGTTLSLKNAIAQFGVTEEQLRDAKLPCRWSSCFGNSFPIFVRDDVARLARETQGAQYEIREARKALRAVNTELSAVDKQRATLAERKEALEAKLSELGATAEEPRKAQPAPKAKAAAKRGGAKGRAQPAKRGKRAGSDDDSDGEWRP